MVPGGSWPPRVQVAVRSSRWRIQEVHCKFIAARRVQWPSARRGLVHKDLPQVVVEGLQDGALNPRSLTFLGHELLQQMPCF